MIRVLYPGSFDPITKGHMNIIEQASDLFDEIVVAVMQNEEKKKGFFTLEERMAMIQKLYQNYDNIRIIQGSGATVDVAKMYQCKAIVRGLRSLSDYNYEYQMHQVNRDISKKKINTICLFADRDFQFVSSSMVKEVFALGKDISEYVDESVEKQMHVKRKSLKR